MYGPFDYFRTKSIAFIALFCTAFLTSVFVICTVGALLFFRLVVSDNASTYETLVRDEDFSANVMPKVVCYYTFPNDGDGLQPEDLPSTMCTHINIAFVGIDGGNHTLHVSNNHSKIVSRVSKLKVNNKNLKIMVSVGGAGNTDFSSMVKNHNNRKIFINSTMRFIKSFDLDGVDIDWEWPTASGDVKEKIKFVQLLQEIREEFDRHKRKYFLSIAAGALQPQVDMYYYVHYIKLYVNFINLMTYDYHFYTSYYPITDYNAPLYAYNEHGNSIISNRNINSSVYYWVSQSMPREMIVLGVPTYGHTYRLRSLVNHDLYAPASGFGLLGRNGFIKYYEVCAFLRDINTFHVTDKVAKVPYAYNQYDWISYDDVNSIGIKAEYILRENLSGAMVYSLNCDDFSGQCSAGKTTFPLLRTIWSTFKQYYLNTIKPKNNLSVTS